MEYGSIEREVEIAAAPDVVFDVISSPEHIKEWWSAETGIGAEAGADGELVWVDEQTGRRETARITVVDAQPPRLFSFRWTHGNDASLSESNSLLVTFELVPAGAGTTLRMTETGFREQGWEAAVLEQQYRGHADGWAFYLPRLRDVAERQGSTP